MPPRSAGLLIYRVRERGLEVLLVHPGGPFFRNKDRGAWTIPKGLVAEGEAPLAAAVRETREETGIVVAGPFLELGAVTQRGGKTVLAFACEGDHDVSAIESNTFELEWPRGSGRRTSFPEVDRAEYFDVGAAREKLNPAQVAFLERLGALLAR